MDKLDRDLEYAISVECKTPLEDVADYEQVSSSSPACTAVLASAMRWVSCFLHAHYGDGFFASVCTYSRNHHVRSVLRDSQEVMKPGSTDPPHWQGPAAAQRQLPRPALNAVRRWLYVLLCGMHTNQAAGPFCVEC